VAFKKVDESLVCSEKKIDSFLKPVFLYVKKEVQFLSLLWMNKCVSFYGFEIKALQ
jgi:hypothetical protein